MSILLHEYHDTVINDIIYRNDNEYNSFSQE